MTIAQADLALTGVNTTSYNVSGGSFAYNSATHTATWTLPQAHRPTDKLLIDLNAGGSNPIRGLNWAIGWTAIGDPTSTTQTGSSTYPSGDGTASGNFLFRFNVLPGDVNQNGPRCRLMTGCWSAGAIGSTPGTGNYSIFKDVNGDGQITAADSTAVKNRLGGTCRRAIPWPERFLRNGPQKRGSRHLMWAAPGTDRRLVGPFRQMVPLPFFHPAANGPVQSEAARCGASSDGYVAKDGVSKERKNRHSGKTVILSAAKNLG